MSTRGGKRIAAWTVALGLLTLAGTAIALHDHIHDQLAIWRLEDPDRHVRERAAERLSQRRVARAVPALARVMRTDPIWEEAPEPQEESPGEPRLPYPEQALVSIGVPALPALLDVLREDAEGLRERAAKALLEIALPPDLAVEALLEVLERTRVIATFCSTAGMLGGLGEPVEGIVPELLGHLARREREDWNCLAEAILEIDPTRPELVAALMKGLGEYTHKRAAAEYLGRMGLAAKAAIPDLLEVLDDTDPEVYTEALRALSRIGCEPAVLLRRLVDLHRSEDHDKRWFAADAIASLGPEATAAVPVLIETLEWGRDSRPLTESTAAALVAIGPEAIAALVTALEGGDGLLRQCAAGALAAFGRRAEAAIPALVGALSDGSLNVRLDAMRALAAIGPAAASAAPALLERLEGEVGWDRRIFAANALLGIGSADPRLVAFLGGALSSELEDVRAEAALGCARLGAASRPALSLLRTAVKDEDVLVRTFAAWALESLQPGSARDLPEFAEALEDDATRGIAVAALADLPEIAGHFLPELIAFLDAEDIGVGVSVAAARAIGRLGPAAAAAAPVLSRCIASTRPDHSYVDNRRTLQHVFIDALESVQGRGPP